MQESAALSKVNRRWFLKALPTGAAGLLFAGALSDASAETAVGKLNPFIEFKANGSILLTCPEAEMGQDVFTSLAKVLADEIGLDWARVEVSRAPHSPDYYNPFGAQATGGSRSMRTWYQPFREMGARIRLAFLNAAAASLDTSTSTLELADGIVRDQRTGRSLTMPQLLGDVASAPLPETAPLKADSALKLIGKSLPRKDIPAKVTGKARYGADVRVPDMLYASVRLIPESLGDASAPGIAPAMKGPGVVSVENLGNAIAVVAKTWWAANMACQSIVPQPARQSAATQTSDASITDTLQAAVDSIDSPPAASDGYHHADYTVPYLSHMCLETMTATARVEKDRAHIWVSTQAPSRFAQRAAKLLGLRVQDITLTNQFLGGGFGRKGTDLQAMEQAVALSKRLGKPVQVMWDRSTDILADQYRPAAAFRLSARLSDDGQVADVRSRSAMQSLAKARLPQFYKKGRPEFPEQGIFPYEAQTSDHRWQEVDMPVAIGFWRSVNGTHYPFAGESFADELAHLADEDPLAFRLSKLSKHPRMYAALERAANMADWSAPRPEGTGLGIGLYEEWGSVAAQVAQVRVTEGALTVEKIWTAIDCGRVISPDTVVAQAESGVHCGLSAALMGKITIQGGQALEQNFDSYPVMDLARSPDIMVELIESDLPPGGVGEIGTPATAPAITNAIFAASGKRIRSLPINQHLDV